MPDRFRGALLAASASPAPAPVGGAAYEAHGHPLPEATLAPFMTAREAPRVAFSELIERGMIPPGTKLVDSKKRHGALVRADGAIMIGAMNLESFYKRFAQFPREKLIVVVGDRLEIPRRPDGFAPEPALS